MQFLIIIIILLYLLELSNTSEYMLNSMDQVQEFVYYLFFNSMCILMMLFLLQLRLLILVL
jgi:hypothetical protein